MISIEVICSMCGGQERYSKQNIFFTVSDPRHIEPQTFKREIEGRGWIVQFNGDNIDTYCTKKCAE
jgi:hypothetical protein